MGEFAGFVVAWNLLLEHVIGVALVAKGIATYVDMLIFAQAGVNLTQIQPITSGISDYFDFFAFFIPILVGGEWTMCFLQTDANIFIRFFLLR